MTSTRKPNMGEADDAVVTFVAGVRARMFAAGDRGARTVDFADLTAALRAVDPQVAVIASGVVETAVRTVTARFDPSVVSAQAVMRAVAAELSGVFSALIEARQDRTALDAAEATVRDIEQRTAATHAELEAAVGDADLDAVLRLRPIAEVKLPSEAERAQLTLLEAQVDFHDVSRRTVAAYVAAADTALQARRDELQAAKTVFDAATDATSMAIGDQQLVGTAATRINSELRTARTRRDELAAVIKDNETRRYRRLAGLDLDDTSSATATPGLDRPMRSAVHPPFVLRIDPPNPFTDAPVSTLTLAGHRSYPDASGEL